MDTLVYLRDRGFDTIEVNASAEERWTKMVETGAASSPFGESSYFFGTNIPGKPRKYLLNSGGRPKLVKEIRRVRQSDYEGVQTVALVPPHRVRLSEVSDAPRADR
jgi:hypothetical protein